MRHGMLAALAAVTLGLSACGMFDKEAQYRVAARELATDMTAMNASDGEHFPAINPTSAATGDAGQFSRNFKSFLIKVISDRKNYRAEMEALHFTQVTAPSALTSSEGLARAQGAVAQAKAITSKYRALNAQRLADIRRDMTAIAAGSAVIQAFQHGFDSSMGGGGGVMAQVSDDELRIFDEYGRLLDDLGHARGRWRPEGSIIMFSNNADADAFNGHMRTIQSAAMDERTLVATQQTLQRQRVDQMNNLAKP
jgi:hypothetical protein